MSGAEDEWRERAGPWARAVLPDGQELDVVVTARYRSRDGHWWYECEAILPARYEAADGTTRPVGAPAPISVPAWRVMPIPGEDYASVPTEGAVAGRQWLLEQLREYRDGPSRRLHRRDCWQAGPRQRLVTTDAARLLLYRAAAEVCEVCRPDRALGGLPGTPGTPGG